MFEDVWRWAGQPRRRETNIGVDPLRLRIAVHDLCEDTLAQVGDGIRLAYPAEELAIRFHHRLVTVHPFVNGNGRHARLAADLLLKDLRQQPFGWGGADLATPGVLRAEYLSALRRADGAGDFDPLLAFARRRNSQIAQ